MDDEQAIAQLLGMLLKTKGYAVEIVSTGTRALERIDSDIDIVLLDLLLPDYEGSKICQQIKTDPLTEHIPVIIISGNNQKNKSAESLNLGADDYLSKPFEPEELFARIEAVLRRHVSAAETGLTKHQYETVAEIRRIIDAEEIIPYFQPIFFLKPFHVMGFEVLSRPQTTTTLSNPEVLFKEALRYGMYFDVEMIGWRKAIQKFKNSGRPSDESLFLNCSPYLVESDKFPSVQNLFNGTGVSSNRIFLEITERSAISEYDLFYDRLKAYRQHGFKIAIDDVGGGYSSLESIVHTHPEVVKLDRHIVKGLESDAYKRSIVKLIIAFCRENGIICIAEGIETQHELELLIDIGVNAGQGYYLSRPKDSILGCLR